MQESQISEERQWELVEKIFHILNYYKDDVLGRTISEFSADSPNEHIEVTFGGIRFNFRVDKHEVGFNIGCKLLSHQCPYGLVDFGVFENYQNKIQKI